jgi:Rad3-related DNA helicase
MKSEIKKVINSKNFSKIFSTPVEAMVETYESYKSTLGRQASKAFEALVLEMLAKRYEDNRVALKRLEDESAEIKSMILTISGEKPVEIELGDYILKVWEATRESKKFNEERFKISQESLYPMWKKLEQIKLDYMDTESKSYLNLKVCQSKK